MVAAIGGDDGEVPPAVGGDVAGGAAAVGGGEVPPAIGDEEVAPGGDGVALAGGGGGPAALSGGVAPLGGDGGAVAGAPVAFDPAAYHPLPHRYVVGPMQRHTVLGTYPADVVLRDPDVHLSVFNRKVSDS